MPPSLDCWNGDVVDGEGWLNLLILPRSLGRVVCERLVWANGEVSPSCPALEKCEDELSVLEPIAYNRGIVSELGPEGFGYSVPPEYTVRLNLGVREG